MLILWEKRKSKVNMYLLHLAEIKGELTSESVNDKANGTKFFKK